MPTTLSKEMSDRMLAMGDVGTKLKHIWHEMRTLLDKAKEPDAPLIALRQEAIALLDKVGLFQRKVRIHSKHVGVHACNRYGDGIIPAAVHALLAGIFSMSFSVSELDKPTAVELPPWGNPRRAALIAFNRKQTEGSNGRLPLYESGGEEIKVITVTCGHTTQTLRIVYYGSPSDHPVLAPDGHLSVGLLRLKQPAYADAVESGIEYDVLVWQIEEVFPDICNLFQEAGNQKNWLMRGTSRLETMFKMHGASKRYLETVPEGATEEQLQVLVWDRVLDQAKSGHVPFESELEDLLCAVRALSGGKSSPTYLELVRDFVRTLETQRIVRGEIWGALAKVQIGGPNLSSKFKIACVLACAGASANYSVGEEQSLLTDTEVHQLSTRHQPHATQADGMITAAERIFASRPPTPLTRNLLFLFMVRLVHHVFRKKDATRGTFLTMNAIGAQFIKDLAQAFGEPVACPFDWVDAPSAEPAPAGVKGCSIAKGAMVEFDIAGGVENINDLLLAKNFAANTFVQRVLDQRQYKIKSIGAQVVLQDDAGVETLVRAEAMLKGNFRVLKITSAVDLESWYERANPSDTTEWQFEVAVSRLKLAMDALNREHLEALRGLRIVSSPQVKKGVYATREFKLRQCVLVPMTTTFAMRKVEEKGNLTNIDSGLVVTDGRDTSKQHKVRSFSICIYH